MARRLRVRLFSPECRLLDFCICISLLRWGTGIRGLMRGVTTPPPKELLVVRDKVGIPPDEQVHGM